MHGKNLDMRYLLEDDIYYNLATLLGWYIAYWMNVVHKGGKIEGSWDAISDDHQIF